VTEVSSHRRPVRDLDFLEQERSRIDEALVQILARETVRLPEGLRPTVEYALKTSGKRLRPILFILAFSAARGHQRSPAAAYRLSCALEIVHTYSLIHDDLPCMDDDDLRRGMPTAHRVFGIARAVIGGAALLPIAVSIIEQEGLALGLGIESRARLVAELMHSAGAEGMVGGQLLDLAAEQQVLTSPELERIHRMKTGALLTSALRTGAIAGKADEALLEALTRYGAALGVAFQIADDLLDVEGTSEDLGKIAGRDVALQKSSYPALHGVGGARSLAVQKTHEAKAAISGLGLTRLGELADYVVERRR
jgi:geranylgeranyl pyrophosphate synthase